MSTRKVYTSDLHLDHMMLLKHIHRPFENVEEQIEVLTKNFNSILRKGDILYVLGDNSITKNGHKITRNFLLGLNATEFHFIEGNHDTKKTSRLDIWTTVSQIKGVKDNGTHVVLCHYPMMQWNRSHHGSVHLFGHSHGGTKHPGNAVDVGIDCWNYMPVLLTDVLYRLGRSGNAQI